jgi:hypothetical protein
VIENWDVEDFGVPFYVSPTRSATPEVGFCFAVGRRSCLLATIFQLEPSMNDRTNFPQFP